MSLKTRLITHLVNNPDHGGRQAAKALNEDMNKVTTLMLDPGFRAELDKAEAKAEAEEESKSNPTPPSGSSNADCGTGWLGG